METPVTMRVLGQPKGTPWDRFVRLQRTMSKLAVGSYSQPRGVFLFRTHEEADQWTLKNRRYHAAPPPTATLPHLRVN